MSAHSLANAALASVLHNATGDNVDHETLLRALISAAVSEYREQQGVDSTRSMLEFQLNNCAGDEDYEFMRP